jgi:hypothetical protein
MVSASWRGCPGIQLLGMAGSKQEVPHASLCVDRELPCSHVPYNKVFLCVGLQTTKFMIK